MALAALLIAEAVTGINARTLSRASRVDLVDSALHAPAAGLGDEDFHPSLLGKKGVWGTWTHESAGEEGASPRYNLTYIGRRGREMGEVDGVKEVERCRQQLDRALVDERLARVKLEAAMVMARTGGAPQRDIAAAASVSQPYVSQVLAERRGRFVPSSRLGYILAARRDDVMRAARRHGVENLQVFGSVARGEDDAASDVDLMADLPSGMGLIGLSKVEAELSDVLGVEVDLVPARSLKVQVRPSVVHDAVPL